MKASGLLINHPIVVIYVSSSCLIFVVDEERTTEEVDDRPLAASAFKAWFGSDSHNQSSLEKKVEQSYQTHMRMDKQQRVVTKRDGMSNQSKVHNL